MIVVITAGTVSELIVTASLRDNQLESANKYSFPRLDPQTAGIASGRRLRRCKKSNASKSSIWGFTGLDA